jgi:hypothetical protein
VKKLEHFGQQKLKYMRVIFPGYILWIKASQHGLWARSNSTSYNLLEKLILRSHQRPVESETLEAQVSNLFVNEPCR